MYNAGARVGSAVVGGYPTYKGRVCPSVSTTVLILVHGRSSLLLMRTQGFGKAFCDLMTNFLRAKRALRRYMVHRMGRRAKLSVGGVACFNGRP